MSCLHSCTSISVHHGDYFCDTILRTKLSKLTFIILAFKANDNFSNTIATKYGSCDICYHIKQITWSEKCTSTHYYCIGVERCKWPGRQQVINRDHVTFYLDGAHTSKSIAACSGWFKSTATEETANLKWEDW